MQTKLPNITEERGQPAAQVTKQVRLLIGSRDASELQRFYLLVLKGHEGNLVKAVALFEGKLLPLFAWLSRTTENQHWRWVTSLPTMPVNFQVRYSRNDELLTRLQDKAFREAFEKAYRLWREYASIFTAVLAHPIIGEKIADKAQAWFTANSTDKERMADHSRGLLGLLRSPENLVKWGQGVL